MRRGQIIAAVVSVWGQGKEHQRTRPPRCGLDPQSNPHPASPCVSLVSRVLSAKPREQTIRDLVFRMPCTFYLLSRSDVLWCWSFAIVGKDRVRILLVE